MYHTLQRIPMVYYADRSLRYTDLEVIIEAMMIDTSIFSLILGILGGGGIITLLTLAGMTLYYYRDSRLGSFRWHIRNVRLKQLSALACMFFLAMAASYGVLHDVWAILYIIFAFKTGTWWLRCAMIQRA